jgi:hypothetical protein
LTALSGASKTLLTCFSPEWALVSEKRAEVHLPILSFRTTFRQNNDYSLFIPRAFTPFGWFCSGGVWQKKLHWRVAFIHGIPGYIVCNNSFILCGPRTHQNLMRWINRSRKTHVKEVLSSLLKKKTYLFVALASGFTRLKACIWF